MFNFTGLQAKLRSPPPHWEHNIVNCTYLPSSVRLNFTRLIGQTGFAFHKKKVYILRLTIQTAKLL